MNCVLTHFGIDLEPFAFMYLHSVCCRFTMMCSKLLCFCGTLSLADVFEAGASLRI